MPQLSTTDIKWFVSTYSVDGINGLGGQRSVTELSDNYLHNLFDKTTKDQQTTGITKVRCGYIFNSNPTDYVKNPILFIVSDTASPSDFVLVGWGSAKIGTGLDADAPSVEQTVTNQHTLPQNVSFFAGNNRNEGAILNADIPPLKGKAYWIYYNSVFNAQDYPLNNFRIRLVADNLYNDVPNPTGTIVPPRIEFPIIGEGSSDFDLSKIIQMMFSRFSDFWVTTGNMNINSDASYFISLIQNYVQRILLSFGSKDVVSSTVLNTYINSIAQFPFSRNIVQRYYSKDYGNIHILLMDTSGATSYLAGSDQYKFIEADLKKAKNNPIIDWIFVVSNRAMYGSQTAVEGRFLFPDLRDTYHKMFTENNVLIFFQGTFRWYERTKVLKYNDATPTAPTTFDYDYVETVPPAIGDRKYTISGQKSFPDGFICITCGTGGSTHDTVSTPASYSLRRNDYDFGFPFVIVDNTGMNKKIMFRFPVSRLTAELYDWFEVERTA